MVKDFSAESANHSFAVGVGLRCADRCLDDLDVLGLEHGVEGVGVLAVAVSVSDEEAERVHADAQVGGEVAGLLGGPGSGGVCGDADDVQAPGLVLEEDQGVQAVQADGVDVEEVAGDQTGGPCGEEPAPGWASAAVYVPETSSVRSRQASAAVGPPVNRDRRGPPLPT